MKIEDSYNNHPLNDYPEKTAVIKVEKKQRRNDSVGWMIGSLLLVFFTLFIAARITIIGQFFDDVVFTFIFGWFKYLVYFLAVVLGISIFIGIRIRLKRRVKYMLIVFVILTCWLVSNILLLIDYFNEEISYFDQQIFIKVLSKYIDHWKSASIFNGQKVTFVGFNGEWFNLFAGGGIIGSLITAIFSYTTIFGSLAFCVLGYFFLLSWAWKGSWLGFFIKSKSSKGHGITISTLKDGRKNKQFFKKRKAYQNDVNLAEDLIYSSRQVALNTDDSDITIQMPSYDSNEEFSLLDDLMYEDRPQTKRQESQNYVDFNKQKTVKKVVNKPIAPAYVPRSDKYIQPRRRQNAQNNDFKQYQSGANLEEARKKFNFDAQVTPFGKITKPPKSETTNTFEQTSLLDESGNTMEFNEANVKNLIDDPKVDFTEELDDGISDFEPPREVKNNQDKKQKDILDLHNDIIRQHIKTNNKSYQNDYEKTKTIEINKPKNLHHKSQQINYDYKLPSLSILNEKEINARNNEINKEAATQKARQINNVFQQFNIPASVKGISIGPIITKFEIHMQPGVKVNKIISLENDLKYALASQNVRIEAPIQGKSAVGIEVANQVSNKVTLREVMEKIPLEKQDKKLLVAIGRSVNGEIIFVELDKMPHLLVAGSTGSGKSVCINTMLSSLLLRTKPYEVKLLLIDPKQVELVIYNNLPHLLAPVITDTKLANAALKKVIIEMERRYSLLSVTGVRNIEAYNNKVSKEERLPYIVVVIDELADLMMTAGKEIEDSIMRITQLARAAGIHMIIATQRPSTDVITGVIKTNIPSRIAFAVASSIDSRTILDQTGAEKLIGYGDMLYAPAGQNIPTRAQGAFISDEEIERLTEHCRSQQPPDFEDEYLELENDSANYVNRSSSSSNDPLYEEVKKFIIVNQRASTSLIQRKFSIGYNRASRLMDALEENGIIGPQNGAKPREVYIQNIEIDEDEW